VRDRGKEAVISELETAYFTEEAGEINEPRFEEERGSMWKYLND